MPLTDAQLAALHDELGDHPDGDLEERFDRLGDTTLVAQSVVRTRLQALLAAPAQFTIPGVISTSNADNIKALQAQLGRLGNGTGDPGALDSATIAQHQTRPRRPRR